MNTTVLILPGIGNSASEHWQSVWERANPSFSRIQQRDWDNPVCAEWCAVLEDVVARPGHSNVVLVAHSLGCLLAAHWAVRTNATIKGALLVAPPDPDGSHYPPEAKGFAPIPSVPLPFRSIVVASDDDPYGSVSFAQKSAHLWGSQLVRVGAKGHINSQSGLGDWPEGFALLRALVE